MTTTTAGTGLMRAPVVRLIGSHALAAVAMSLPWPWLLVLVWDGTHDPRLLGVAAAARMIPYVACSWCAARLGDHLRRDVVVRATVAGRLVLLTAVPVAVALGSVATAVVLAALAVAVATPAYPALAAAMPDFAGPGADRATDVLVTVEVASFVVGPAFGGLLLAVPWLVAPAAVLATAVALALLTGIRLAPAARRTTSGGGIRAELRRSAPLRRALVLMALLNLVLAALGVSLVLMARGDWTGWWTSDTAYGVASGALGFGALAAPSLAGLGHAPVGRARAGVVLLALTVLVLAASPTVLWALLPLVVAGASAVHAEAAATGIVQEAARDEVRASMFGLADTCMVGAAMLGALVAPELAVRVGPAVLVAGLGVVAAASALVVRRVPAQAGQPRPSTTVAPASSSETTSAENPAAVTNPTVRSA